MPLQAWGRQQLCAEVLRALCHPLPAPLTELGTAQSTGLKIGTVFIARCCKGAATPHTAKAEGSTAPTRASGTAGLIHHPLCSKKKITTDYRL